MKLYSTLTRQVETLKPISPNEVKIYNCGLTVYSQPHIGNWLGYIYWDVLTRVLQDQGLIVNRTQNITDVGHLTSDDDNGEDKMEKGARREGLTAWDVAEKYIAIANQESSRLNLTPPTQLVRATTMIEEQIEFAKQLDDKGFLYKIDDDGMYFDTSKLDDYGKLARLDIQGLEAGARVSVEGKRNITDFAVWKFSPQDSHRDMEWDSPWGRGFPGWHLECSVIALRTLGDQIDIHTGGIDHIPVHHTNEIAQTEALTGKDFSKIWLHVNHIKSDGQKMSKSLGNIYTLEDIQNRGFDLAAFRLFTLGKHYRTEGNFTWNNLEAAQNRLNHWREISDLRWQPVDSDSSADDQISTDILQRFDDALNDDLNTPLALSIVDSLVATIEQVGMTPSNLHQFAKMIQKINQLLGIDLNGEDITEEQKDLIAQRQAARNTKDWALSDQIRDELLANNIGLRDTALGSSWYRIHNPNQ